MDTPGRRRVAIMSRYTSTTTIDRAGVCHSIGVRDPCAMSMREVRRTISEVSMVAVGLRGVGAWLARIRQPIGIVMSGMANAVEHSVTTSRRVEGPLGGV